MASDIAGLFTTPEQYQQNQLAQFQNRAAQEVQLSPFQQAALGARTAGYQLGQGVGSALGGQDPQLQLISRRQQIASQLDQTDPNSYKSLARIAASSGDPQFAMFLVQEGMKIEKESAQIAEYKGVQAERERSATEKQTVIASRVKALLDSGVATNEGEARAIASNEGAFTEAIGLSKLPPAAKAEKAMYATASQLYPNDPVAQYQYVEQIKAGSKPPTDAEVKDIAEVKQANNLIQVRIAKTDDLLKLVTGENPKVNFGPFSNVKAAAEATGIFGEPSQNTRAQDQIRAHLTEGINSVLNAAKGVQAKDDAERAKTQIEGYLKLNTNAGAEQALTRLKQAQQDVLSSNQVFLESRVRNFPKQNSTSANPTNRLQELLNKASPEQRKLLGK